MMKTLLLFLSVVLFPASTFAQCFDAISRNPWCDSTWYNYIRMNRSHMDFIFDYQSTGFPGIRWQETQSGDTLVLNTANGGGLTVTPGIIYLAHRGAYAVVGQGTGYLWQDNDSLKVGSPILDIGKLKVSNVVKVGTIPAKTIAFVIDTVERSAQTGTITATNFVNANNQAGWYKATVYHFVTTAGTAGTATLKINWNDGSSTKPATLTSLSLTSLNNWSENNATFYRASGNATWEVTVTGATGSPAYKFFLMVEKLPF